MNLVKNGNPKGSLPVREEKQKDLIGGALKEAKRISDILVKKITKLSMEMYECKGEGFILKRAKGSIELDEYLAFRHLFRNIYGFELEGNRLDDLVERFPDVAGLFNKEIIGFIKEL